MRSLVAIVQASKEKKKTQEKKNIVCETGSQTGPEVVSIHAVLSKLKKIIHFLGIFSYFVFSVSFFFSFFFE